MNRDAEDAVLKNVAEDPESDTTAAETGLTQVPGTGKMPQTQPSTTAR